MDFLLEELHRKLSNHVLCMRDDTCSSASALPALLPSEQRPITAESGSSPEEKEGLLQDGNTRSIHHKSVSREGTPLPIQHPEEKVVDEKKEMGSQKLCKGATKKKKSSKGKKEEAATEEHKEEVELHGEAHEVGETPVLLFVPPSISLSPLPASPPSALPSSLPSLSLPSPSTSSLVVPSPSIPWLHKCEEEEEIGQLWLWNVLPIFFAAYQPLERLENRLHCIADLPRLLDVYGGTPSSPTLVSTTTTTKASISSKGNRTISNRDRRHGRPLSISPSRETTRVEAEEPAYIPKGRSSRELLHSENHKEEAAAGSTASFPAVHGEEGQGHSLVPPTAAAATEEEEGQGTSAHGTSTRPFRDASSISRQRPLLVLQCIGMILQVLSSYSSSSSPLSWSSFFRDSEKDSYKETSVEEERTGNADSWLNALLLLTLFYSDFATLSPEVFSCLPVVSAGMSALFPLALPLLHSYVASFSSSEEASSLLSSFIVQGEENEDDNMEEAPKKKKRKETLLKTCHAIATKGTTMHSSSSTFQEGASIPTAILLFHELRALRRMMGHWLSRLAVTNDRDATSAFFSSSFSSSLVPATCSALVSSFVSTPTRFQSILLGLRAYYDSTLLALLPPPPSPSTLSQEGLLLSSSSSSSLPCKTRWQRTGKIEMEKILWNDLIPLAAEFVAPLVQAMTMVMRLATAPPSSSTGTAGKPHPTGESGAGGGALTSSSSASPSSTWSTEGEWKPPHSSYPSASGTGSGGASTTTTTTAMTTTRRSTGEMGPTPPSPLVLSTLLRELERVLRMLHYAVTYIEEREEAKKRKQNNAISEVEEREIEPSSKPPPQQLAKVEDTETASLAAGASTRKRTRVKQAATPSVELSEEAASQEEEDDAVIFGVFREVISRLLVRVLTELLHVCQTHSQMIRLQRGSATTSRNKYASYAPHDGGNAAWEKEDDDDDDDEGALEKEGTSRLAAAGSTTGEGSAAPNALPHRVPRRRQGRANVSTIESPLASVSVQHALQVVFTVALQEFSPLLWRWLMIPTPLRTAAVSALTSLGGALVLPCLPLRMSSALPFSFLLKKEEHEKEVETEEEIGMKHALFSPGMPSFIRPCRAILPPALSSSSFNAGIGAPGAEDDEDDEEEEVEEIIEEETIVVGEDGVERRVMIQKREKKKRKKAKALDQEHAGGGGHHTITTNFGAFTVAELTALVLDSLSFLDPIVPPEGVQQLHEEGLQRMQYTAAVTAQKEEIERRRRMEQEDVEAIAPSQLLERASTANAHELRRYGVQLLRRESRRDQWVKMAFFSALQSYQPSALVCALWRKDGRSGGGGVGTTGGNESTTPGGSSGTALPSPASGVGHERNAVTVAPGSSSSTNRLKKGVGAMETPSSVTLLPPRMMEFEAQVRTKQALLARCLVQMPTCYVDTAMDQLLIRLQEELQQVVQQVQREEEQLCWANGEDPTSPVSRKRFTATLRARFRQLQDSYDSAFALVMQVLFMCYATMAPTHAHRHLFLLSREEGQEDPSRGLSSDSPLSPRLQPNEQDEEEAEEDDTHEAYTSALGMEAPGRGADEEGDRRGMEGHGGLMENTSKDGGTLRPTGMVDHGEGGAAGGGGIPARLPPPGMSTTSSSSSGTTTSRGLVLRSYASASLMGLNTENPTEFLAGLEEDEEQEEDEEGNSDEEEEDDEGVEQDALSRRLRPGQKRVRRTHSPAGVAPNRERGGGKPVSRRAGRGVRVPHRDRLEDGEGADATRGPLSASPSRASYASGEGGAFSTANDGNGNRLRHARTSTTSASPTAMMAGSGGAFFSDDSLRYPSLYSIFLVRVLEVVDPIDKELLQSIFLEVPFLTRYVWWYWYHHWCLDESPERVRCHVGITVLTTLAMEREAYRRQAVQLLLHLCMSPHAYARRLSIQKIGKLLAAHTPATRSTRIASTTLRSTDAGVPSPPSASASAAMGLALVSSLPSSFSEGVEGNEEGARVAGGGGASSATPSATSATMVPLITDETFLLFVRHAKGKVSVVPSLRLSPAATRVEMLVAAGLAEGLDLSTALGMAKTALPDMAGTSAAPSPARVEATLILYQREVQRLTNQLHIHLGLFLMLCVRDTVALLPSLLEVYRECLNKNNPLMARLLIANEDILLLMRVVAPSPALLFALRQHSRDVPVLVQLLVQGLTRPLREAAEEMLQRRTHKKNTSTGNSKDASLSAEPLSAEAEEKEFLRLQEIMAALLAMGVSMWHSSVFPLRSSSSSSTTAVRMDSAWTASSSTAGRRMPTGEEDVSREGWKHTATHVPHASGERPYAGVGSMDPTAASRLTASGSLVESTSSSVPPTPSTASGVPSHHSISVSPHVPSLPPIPLRDFRFVAPFVPFLSAEDLHKMYLPQFLYFVQTQLELQRMSEYQLDRLTAHERQYVLSRHELKAFITRVLQDMFLKHPLQASIPTTGSSSSSGSGGRTRRDGAGGSTEKDTTATRAGGASHPPSHGPSGGASDAAGTSSTSTTTHKGIAPKEFVTHLVHHRRLTRVELLLYLHYAPMETARLAQLRATALLAPPPPPQVYARSRMSASSTQMTTAGLELPSAIPMKDEDKGESGTPYMRRNAPSYAEVRTAVSSASTAEGSLRVPYVEDDEETSASVPECYAPPISAITAREVIHGCFELMVPVVIPGAESKEGEPNSTAPTMMVPLFGWKEVHALLRRLLQQLPLEQLPPQLLATLLFVAPRLSQTSEALGAASLRGDEYTLQTFLHVVRQQVLEPLAQACIWEWHHALWNGVLHFIDAYYEECQGLLMNLPDHVLAKALRENPSLGEKFKRQHENNAAFRHILFQGGS